MRFTSVIPAVALAATASSIVPTPTHAAPSPKTAPHSVAGRKHAALRRVKTATPSATQTTGDTGAAGSAAPTPTTTGPQQPSADVRHAVKTLLAAINADRAAHTLAPLKLNAQESRCSRKHSKHMAIQGKISHDQFPTDVCVPYRYAAENVGFVAEPVTNAVMSLHHLMMGEGPCPTTGCIGAQREQHGHYLNLVNPAYKHVGIGIVVKEGITWLTEDFTT